MPTTINGTTGVSLVQDNVITSLNQPSGSVIQVANYPHTTYQTFSTIIPLDNTIPQNTEGSQYMSATITPKKANSVLKIEIVVNISTFAALDCTVALFRDSAVNAIGASYVNAVAANQGRTVPMVVFVNSTAAVSTTFTVRLGGGTATAIYLNGFNAAQLFGGISSSSITITEIAQ